MFSFLQTNQARPLLSVRQVILVKEATLARKREEKQDKVILNQVSLDVSEGSIIGVIGASGAGKSMLLRTIMGLELISSGSIWLRGILSSEAQQSIPPEQRCLGWASQKAHLFPHLTVRENISFALSTPGARADIGLEELLRRFELNEYADHSPWQLSGGQRHRVALARCLAPQRDFYLLDEPLAHLDPSLRLRLSREVADLLKSRQASALWVTHQLSTTMPCFDELLVLSNGEVIAQDQVSTLINHPPSREVAQALGALDTLSLPPLQFSEWTLSLQRLLSPLQGALHPLKGQHSQVSLQPYRWSLVNVDEAGAIELTVLRREIEGRFTTLHCGMQWSVNSDDLCSLTLQLPTHLAPLTGTCFTARYDGSLFLQRGGASE